MISDPGMAAGGGLLRPTPLALGTAATSPRARHSANRSPGAVIFAVSKCVEILVNDHGNFRKRHFRIRKSGGDRSGLGEIKSLLKRALAGEDLAA